MKKRSPLSRWIFASLVLCTFTLSALGVGTSHWTHTTEADFKAGKFQNVVATNLGDLKLSRAVKTLMEQDPNVSSVYAMVEAPDHTIYAGTGPKGVVLQIKDGKVTPLVTLESGDNVFSLLIDDKGRLLIGTAGDKGRVLRIDKPGDKPVEIFSADDVQYIWAMRQTPDGLLYVATGPNGQLFEIDQNDKSKVLFTCNENNLMCMASDGKDLLYVGTDPNGLVYRINRKTGEVFVLFDAAESEISVLTIDGAGNLYAATGESSDQPMAAAQAPGAAGQTGRPETVSTTVPIPSQPPENPEPPKLPDPNPGEPAPIPKAEAPRVEKPVAPTGAPRLALGGVMKAGDADAKPEDGEPPETPVDPEPAQPASAGGEPAHHPPAITGAGGTPRAEGNAIYLINKDGFVSEIFRQPVLVLSMLEKDGTLLVGTGSEGLIYQVRPAAEETVVLAKVEPKQVMSMLAASDGNIYLGLANIGGIATMSSGFASEGTYTSPVLDAQQISRFGKMQLHGALPADTSISVATRSGNVAEAGELGWSAWSEDVPASRFVQVASPSARYLQYRVTFKAKDAKESPVVEDVDVAYQIPNLPPLVQSITLTNVADPAAAPAAAGAPAAPAPGAKVQIAWEASDPNSDAMRYSLYYRTGQLRPWILIKEKVETSPFEWDTRGVADGRYEVRVVATDASANAPGTGRTASRVSDPVVVDNTAPVIGDIKVAVKGTSAQVTAKAVDASSIVTGMHYTVDAKDDWQAVLPSDNIYDSSDEAISFTVPDLPSGSHQITIRATDSRGNQAFENVLITVEAQAGAEK